MVRFNIHVFTHSKAAARLGSCSLLLLAGGCSVYSADLLDGSGALSSAGGSAMPIGGTADATGSAGFDSANAGTGGTSQSQAGDGVVGDGDAGQGAVSAGGSGNAGGSGDAGGKGGAGGKSGGSGAGGKSGSGGAGGGSAGSTNSAGAPPSNTDLIDDFEDGDKLIRIVSNPRRDGIWDTNYDTTASGVQTPAPSMFAPTLLGADAPYAGDVYAAHSTGTGFTAAGFGAYMNVSMRAVADYALTPVYDASSFKGISFLAKASSASSKIMRVRFVSGDTDPRLGKCAVPGTSETACYNHYYATVTLTTTWALHTVDFSSFVQGTDGMMNPSIDLKEMFGLEFYFAPPSNYDLWLDDLNFTK